MRQLYFLFILLFIASLATAQVRTYKAQEITVSPKIDGVIEDDIWSKLPKASDFTQTIPQPLAPATYRSEVSIAYTQNAIYVLAKLYQPRASVQKQLTARDNIGFTNADVFAIYFDTYQDQQNGFAFKVSAAGVQQEERLYNGGGKTGDRSWDAAWDSKVKIYDDYWVVEMEIPFQALRFSSTDVQKWGVQFYRLNRKQNEDSYWNTVDPQQTGFLAQAGILEGIEHITPPVRLIFFPYLSTGFQHVPQEGGSASNDWLRSGGMDVKYGINDAFTLDMTLIPDFSQVISDNLIRNTSAFEQQLSENRPFFQEGVELFQKQGLFYSRRIGARPSDYNAVNRNYGDTSEYEIEKNPSITPLYNSFKISGRTKANLGIGIFNAVGAPARASIVDRATNESFSVNTEPLANYNILVLDQPLRGQSFVNFTNTNVIRSGTAPEGNVSALQLKWFDKKEDNFYDISAAVSSRTNKGQGTKILAEYAKINGKIRINERVRYLSPNYDQTDLGLQFTYNDLQSYTQFRYFENKPKASWLQLYNIYLTNTISYNAQPMAFRNWEVTARYFMLFKNFLDASIAIEATPQRPVDFYQLRGFGQRIKMFPYIFTQFNGSTDSRRKLFLAWDYGLGRGTIDPNPYYMYANNTVRYRFSDKLEVSTTFRIQNNESNLGYSFYDNSLAQPAVAFRDVLEQTAQLNVSYNFSPLLNLTGRLRHYNSKISNKSFHTVDGLGNWENNIVNANTADYNENFNLQNIDIFLNWIYSPGSRMVISYKQWLNNAYVLNNEFGNSFGTNFTRIVEQPKAYELAVRFIYYLDYNQLKEWARPKKKF